MSNREVCAKLVSPDYPVAITKDEKTGDCRILEGKFTTPFAEVMPGIVPKESEEAHFQVMLPNKWKDPKFRPMCIHLAGTGDHVRINNTCRLASSDFEFAVLFPISITGNGEILWLNL